MAALRNSLLILSLLPLLAGCVTSSSQVTPGQGGGTADYRPSQDRLAVVVINQSGKDDIDADLAYLKGQVVSRATKAALFASVGDDTPDLTLTLTVTHLKKIDGAAKVADWFVPMGPARAWATFQLVDRTGAVVRSGTIESRSPDTGYTGYTSQALDELAQETVDQLKP